MASSGYFNFHILSSQNLNFKISNFLNSSLNNLNAARRITCWRWRRSARVRRRGRRCGTWCRPSSTAAASLTNSTSSSWTPTPRNTSSRRAAFPYNLPVFLLADINILKYFEIFKRFSCQRQGASADNLHVKACTILPLVGLARSKQTQSNVDLVLSVYTGPRQSRPI